MTNEQLAALLESYRRKLAEAIREENEGDVAMKGWNMIRGLEKELCHTVDTLRGIQRV